MPVRQINGQEKLTGHTDSLETAVLRAVRIIPAVFVVLQGAPILFYDLVGDKKKKVTEELLAKHGINEE